MSDSEIDEMLNDNPSSGDENVPYEEDESDESSQIILVPRMNSADITGISSFQEVIMNYNAFMWKYPAKKLDNSTLYLEIPSNFLPLALQSTFGFLNNKTLLEVTIELTEFSWKKTPRHIELKHPQYKTSYVGKPLINQIVTKFFSLFFEPRPKYKSASYLLSPPGEADSKLAYTLRDEGFDSNLVENALRIFHNDLAKSREFLRTGAEPPEDTKINIEYSSCPLLYLVLEICETFFDLCDHCCICGKELIEPGIKPACCDNPVCQFGLSELGIGNQVYQEIRRDPCAADLVFSLFATALYGDSPNPIPVNGGIQRMKKLCNDMPSMTYLVNKCHNDEELNAELGSDMMDLLRWVILSNRVQLISLPKSMELPAFKGKCKKMFMSLISTPKNEEIFRNYQSKYGSIFLWHGSNGIRWHSILRNGLINASGTKLQANGAALGSGIYFARSSGTSNTYAQSSENGYKNSMLGRSVRVIGLCEVANVPELIDHSWAHTLTNEKAVIVRFLLFDLEGTFDVIQRPPHNLPTLKDVLEYKANEASELN